MKLDAGGRRNQRVNRRTDLLWNFKQLIFRFFEACPRTERRGPWLGVINKWLVAAGRRAGVPRQAISREHVVYVDRLVKVNATNLVAPLKGIFPKHITKEFERGPNTGFDNRGARHTELVTHCLNLGLSHECT